MESLLRYLAILLKQRWHHFEIWFAHSRFQAESRQHFHHKLQIQGLLLVLGQLLILFIPQLAPLVQFPQGQHLHMGCHDCWALLLCFLSKLGQNLHRQIQLYHRLHRYCLSLNLGIQFGRINHYSS